MHFSYTKMNNLGVIRLKKFGLLMLLLGCTILPCHAAKISIRYEKPDTERYLPIYKTLKSNHHQILGESVCYLRDLYDWNNDIQIIVTSCGFVNSQFQPENQRVIICYESLYEKIYDYPKAAESKEAFAHRVFQNTMFTFWHEMGHAVMDQFGISEHRDALQVEKLADEFATLSMIWRGEAKWTDVIMISALHFKSKSATKGNIKYKNHPKDESRYQRMIALLYGFASKSYSRLSDQVNQLEWLSQSSQEYYLERSQFWEEKLRPYMRTDFFNN